MNIVKVVDADGAEFDFFLALPDSLGVADVDAAIVLVKERYPDEFTVEDLLGELPGASVLSPATSSEAW